MQSMSTTNDSFDGESDIKQVISRDDRTICEETSSRVRLSGKCVNSRVSYKHWDSDDENESSEDDFNQAQLRRTGENELQ